MRVKICGISCKEDMEIALHAGASALGFLVGITHKAEDKVTNEVAKKLISLVPPFVSSVAVTHLTNVDKIIELVRYINATTVQIHDYIPPEDVEKVRQGLPGIKVIKAVHVLGRDAIEIARSYVPYVNAILLDSRTKDRLGGTGLTHDWNLSKEIVQSLTVPVILAGGLKPGNVYEAVKTVQPFAIDVNSGVEINGKKDALKVKQLINEATKAESFLSKD